MMELWRKVWRFGFAPQFTEFGLRRLERALRDDDSRLLQGATCSPPLLDALVDTPVAGTCALCWAGWRGDGRERVGDVDALFQALCDTADREFGEPAACRFFLHWYDSTPRSVMRQQLLAEVHLALECRYGCAA